MDMRIIKIANTYGYAAQAQMLIEEMAELTQAICKYNRAHLKDTDKAFENVKEELADVQIMLLQLKCLIFLSDEELKELMDKKIERQLGRISKEEEKTLQKARAILEDVAKEMWNSDYVDVQDRYYATKRIADNIGKVLDGEFDGYY